MASAIGLRSERTVHIDRSKETDGFYRLICEQTHYTKRKEDLENDNGDSQMSFPILCIFLYLDYEHVLSV